MTRIYQVQREISEQTDAEPLDPGELGIRYAEIEARCRQMRDEGARTRARNLAVLTEAQKVKLAALEEAVKLLPIAGEASAGNLLAQSYPQISYPSIAFSAALTSLGYPGVPACWQPRQTVGAVIRDPFPLAPAAGR